MSKRGVRFLAAGWLALALGGMAIEAQAQAQNQAAPPQTELQVPSAGPMKSTDLGPAIPQTAPSNVNVQPRSPYSATRPPNPVPPPPEIAASLDTFFKGLMRSDVKKSFGLLLQGSRLAAQEDSVNYYVDKIQQALTLYGKVSDYEVYDTRIIGAHLVATTYISSLAINPLKWRFVYYRAGNDKGWVLIKLSISDSIDDLVE
ncbi:hypothetical protein [Verrucomicrobium sp. GAS474]|uniref:hypothetical protein n=1 Tax=Verrucomicrobium sp. GAS474 TaxID=1882831 RepID=UPI000B859605|nr:hypothetical protein [Verrucomicrobium sp. GAS474]